MVSFSPNPYPWSRDNLMQEWPQWVSAGVCDVLNVQCYRRDSLAYANTVKLVQKHINLPKTKKMLFAPGVLLMVSGQITDAQQLKKQLLTNRKLGTDGEVLFYNEGLRSPEVKQVIQSIYKNKVDFPLN